MTRERKQTRVKSDVERRDRPNQLIVTARIEFT